MCDWSSGILDSLEQGPVKDEFILYVSSIDCGSRNRSFSAHIFFQENIQSGGRGSGNINVMGLFLLPFNKYWWRDYGCSCLPAALIFVS